MKVEIILLTIVFLILPARIWAQDDNLDRISFSTDTVFILLEKNCYSKLMVGKGVYTEPDKGYPMDAYRNYFIDIYTHIESMTYWKISFHFLMHPQTNKPFYYLEDRKRFLKRDYVDCEWFNEHDYEFIRAHFEGKVLMLVDPAYLHDGRFYVVRVRQYIGEE